MKEPKRLLSHGATDFERQLLRAVASERPSALLRSRMQRSLGLVGPLAWASNVKAMFGSLGRKVAVGTSVAGVVVAGGVAAYQLSAHVEGDATHTQAPAVVTAPAQPMAAAELPAAPEPAAPEPSVASPAPASAPAALDDTEDGRLREEIALLDGVKAALQRGDREQARQSLDVYRERFPAGILRREANVLRRRAAAISGAAKPSRASDESSYED
jgi:hypothetical protein